MRVVRFLRVRFFSEPKRFDERLAALITTIGFYGSLQSIERHEREGAHTASQMVMNPVKFSLSEKAIRDARLFQRQSARTHATPM